MKKSELKASLQLAKTTLRLAMDTLKQAYNELEAKEIKAFDEAVKKYAFDDNYTEPQAGDKIVESNNSDWFTKNDDGTYTIKLSPNTKLFEWIAKEDDSKVTRWNEPILNDFNEQEEINRANYEEFKQRGKEPKKETPLSDLNKEVQEELSKKNDLSCKSTDSTNCESYVIQAKEAVDKFMPLVNGWVKCQPFAEGSKIFEHEGNGHIDQSFWKWNIVNYRKAAIKVAIAHFELIQKQGGWLTHIDCVQIINELQKMLSE